MADEGKKVFIVTAGEYSEYHMVAVFSTEAAAEVYAEQERSLGGRYSRSWGIEEFPLDERAGWVARKAWRSHINLTNGGMPGHYDTKGTMIVASPGERGHAKYQNELCAYAISFISQEHADKLVVEARQAWLRKQAEGVPR